MKKIILGVILFLLSMAVLAAPPDRTTTNNTTNNYYTTTPDITTVNTTINISGDLAKIGATSNAFAALNFERSNKSLQWSCGYGYYDDEGSIVCGLGLRIGDKNGLLLNGATTIGAENGERAGNIGIGGTFR